MFFREKKINFEKDKLVVCKTAVMVDCKNFLWLSLDTPRILIEKEDAFYDTGYSEDIYYKGYNSLKRGERFVEKTDHIPIQENKRITLTPKELKTKKISLKRIREIEQQLK